jgi:hypothetical protein
MEKNQLATFAALKKRSRPPERDLKKENPINITQEKGNLNDKTPSKGKLDDQKPPSKAAINPTKEPMIHTIQKLLTTEVSNQKPPTQERSR